MVFFKCEVHFNGHSLSDFDFFCLGLVSYGRYFHREFSFRKIPHYIMTAVVGAYSDGSAFKHDYYMRNMFSCCAVYDMSVYMCVGIVRFGRQHNA